MSLGSLSGSISLRRAFAGLLFSLCILGLSPDALAQLRDAAGSKDHPMIKRFEGSTIIGYEFKKFNDLVVLLGPAKGKYSKFLDWEYEHGREALPLTLTKSQTVEGEATRILYVAPAGRSPLEILRNYERELQRNGFQALFKCAREECSVQDGALGWLYLYPPKRRLKNTPPLSVFALTFATDQQFMTAKRTGPGADAYVSLYVANATLKEHKETFEHPIILLEVVETVPMENKMVTVDAATMAKEVAAAGHVALYGIYFDTNKTDIKPESAPAIDEIAKFLKQDAKMIVYVVGHTDNVGGYEYNMGLSLRRAEAVVKELTARHGIPATQLKAAGTGSLAPVAPNETEEGRAKNRRVELVRQ
jgi:OmpA-OmpF porin, OOP family